MNLINKRAQSTLEKTYAVTAKQHQTIIEFIYVYLQKNKKIKNKNAVQN